MRVVIKDLEQTNSEFKVEQVENIINTYNKVGQIIHFIDIKYLSINILYHGWIGFRSHDQLREILDGHFIDLFTKYKCKGMLIDNSKMEYSFTDNNKWLAEYFMPKMVQAGLKYNAVVLPKDIFSQISIKEWDDKISGFESKNFDQIYKALDWLKSK